MRYEELPPAAARQQMGAFLPPFVVDALLKVLASNGGNACAYGSTRQGRFAPAVANWFSSYIQTREEFVTDEIDLVDTALPDVLSKSPEPAVEALRPRLAAADAFVVITPEHNHSFPAPLKTAIDWYSKEWQAKPVAFVSYGGNAGGLRAVEQLRQVVCRVARGYRAQCHRLCGCLGAIQRDRMPASPGAA